MVSGPYQGAARELLQQRLDAIQRPSYLGHISLVDADMGTMVSQRWRQVVIQLAHRDSAMVELQPPLLLP